MRRRIVWSTVAVVALVLVTFALPLAIAVRNLEIGRGLDAVESAAEQAAVIVSSQARTLGEVELILGVLAQRQGLRLTLFQGTELALVDTGPGPVPPPDAPTARAARGQVGRAHLDGSLRAAAPLVGVGRSGLVLRAIRDDAAVERAVGRSTSLIGLGALVVLGLATAGAWLQAQRLSRPFEQLARSARRLGRGDFTARAQRFDLEEADAIADALDTTAERLSRALDRGTAFAADASHQLRTPLTALRLHLEALAADPDRPQSVDDALAEADRLDATIDELVALTRPETSEQIVDPAALVRERAAGWRAQLTPLGRDLHLSTEAVPEVRVRTAAVVQALQVLVDNAARHGAGDVSVRVRPATGGAGVRIEVEDEGPGVPHEVTRRGRDRGGPGDESPPTGGRGLVLARALLEAEGGSLVVDGGVPCVLLPPVGPQRPEVAAR